MIRWGRLGCRHVYTRPTNLPAAHGLDQGGLVDESAPCRVDDQGLTLHEGKLGLINEMPGVLGKGAMQTDDITAFQDRGEWRVRRWWSGIPLAPCINHLHPECGRQPRGGLSQCTPTDDSQHAATQITNGIIVVAELPGVLSTPPGHRLAVCIQSTP